MTRPNALRNNGYVDQLVREGIAAYAAGHREQAHDLWRQAAALRPHDEDIWGALLSVVETVEDRYVCLENIVAINPKNDYAAKQLHSLTPAYETARKNKATPEPRPQSNQHLRRSLLVLSALQGLKLLFLMITLLVIMALGVLFGVMLNLL